MSKKGKRIHTKGFKGSIAVLVILAVIAICYFGYTYALPAIMQNTETETNASQYIPVDGEMEVHIIDVGQGDSSLIISGDGVILIDAGPGSAEQSLHDYLNDVGITRIDYAIFTHPDEDHIGGADMIMKDFDVKNVIMPNCVKTTKTYENMISAIEASDADVIQAVSGTEYALGDIKFKVLAPNSDSYDDTNNYSVVIKLSYGNSTFMFTGDAEKDSESEILNTYNAAELDCDFLKVGHHGSTTSTSKAFLTAVSPSIASISCGEGNKYGHPHTETLEKLKKAGVEVYRTDLLGTIVFVCDGQTITVKG